MLLARRCEPKCKHRRTYLRFALGYMLIEPQMAYMMQHLHMGLMDAYLVTRARRLNGSCLSFSLGCKLSYSLLVLIQPNLRFFHELFGWEVELARREATERESRLRKAERTDGHATGSIEGLERRILYSWPSFCRDLVSSHC